MPRAAFPVLITGGSRGLGRAVAVFLAAQGYDLALTARGTAELDATARALRHYGGQVLALAGDVADPVHRRRLVHAVRDFGRLDILLNNASVLGATPLPPLIAYPLDALDEAFSINVVAPIALIQETLPLLEQAGGLIVNITSDAARAGYAGWGGYGLTKAALDLASLTLANELRGHGIGVVAVDPGDLRTRMHQEAFPGEDISDRPLPEVTLPFWAWLFEQPRASVTGHRYEAQADRWRIDPKDSIPPRPSRATPRKPFDPLWRSPVARRTPVEHLRGGATPPGKGRHPCGRRAAGAARRAAPGPASAVVLPDRG